MDDWHRMLARARSRLGVSQVDLAARSHVSHASVKAYEEGKRHPSRPYLTAMLDALKIDRVERNLILAAAGCAPNGLSRGSGRFSLVEGHPARVQADVERTL